MNYSAALAGFGTSAGLIIAIGAQNAFVLRQGLRREHVGLVVLACTIGDIVCILAGVAGMGAAVKAHPLVLEIFRWGGAAFLGYYGCLALNRARKGGEALGVASDSGNGPAVSPQRVLAACLAFTFLNPHVYLDTFVMLGSISTQFAGADRWLFALGACTASVTWFTSLGYGAKRLQPLFRKPRSWQCLDLFIALVMFSIALTLVLNPLTDLAV